MQLFSKCFKILAKLDKMKSDLLKTIINAKRKWQTC